MTKRQGVGGTAVILACAAAVAASAAGPVRKASPPRIVAAAMLDADRDARADGVRLTYSMRVRHSADRDGRYPFTVGGYGIRSVGLAGGRSLMIRLVERSRPDPSARPAIRYRQTRSKPVTGRSGRQAGAQLFRGTRAHRRTPPPLIATTPTTTTTTTTSTTTPTPTALDADGDGSVDARDCAPRDAKIHPSAADVPDLAFVDSNCDGIDGTERAAIFASPKGNDANPGTKEKPKRQIQAAVQAAAGNGKYVLAAAGQYEGVSAASGVGIYGGYETDGWSRKDGLITLVANTGTFGAQGLFADGNTDVTLQLLSIRGSRQAYDAYGIRAINGSSLRLQRVTVTAGDGAPGAVGANGAAGRPGDPGLPGARGACDNNVHAEGGAGGASPVGRDGGKGGNGRYGARGQDGSPGIVGTPGGKGADAHGNEYTVHSGYSGANGSNGSAGTSGPGGTNTTELASGAGWQGRGGVDGVYGAPGNGGGGGGAGGGQYGILVLDGTGNAGGGGGGGGEGGRGGSGGRAGGGSFGVWLHASVLVAEKSTIAAGNGGAGGRGGNGGQAGSGGAGADGAYYCTNEIGFGGRGGRGGSGGQGGGAGGGAGGPSIGVFKLGGAQSRLTLSETKIVAGTPGAGGATGAGGTPAPRAEAGIAAAVYPS